MTDKRLPLQLVIDGNKKTATIVKGEIINVVEIPDEMIRTIDITVALNGGFAVVITYDNLDKEDVLVFQTSQELLFALSKLVKN